jgi:hypothetical protein
MCTTLAVTKATRSRQKNQSGYFIAAPRTISNKDCITYEFQNMTYYNVSNFVQSCVISTTQHTLQNNHKTESELQNKNPKIELEI